MIIPCATKYDAEEMYWMLLGMGKRNLKRFSQGKRHEVEYEEAEECSGTTTVI